MANQNNIVRKRHKVKLRIPTWVVRVYAILAIVLIPWVFYVGETLPRRHVILHYDVSWAGLDIGLVFVFLLTAFLAYKKSRWMVMTATASGSFLVIDAWFDVLGSRPGVQLNEAVILALFVEIPLALLSFALAGHILMRNID